MSFEVAEFFLRLLPIALSVVAGAWTLYVYRAGARKEEIEKLNTRIDMLSGELDEHKESGQDRLGDLKERIVAVEYTLAQMPDKESVHKLDVSVTEIKGDVRVLDQKVTAVGATAHRVEAFLLNKGNAA